MCQSVSFSLGSCQMSRILNFHNKILKLLFSWMHIEHMILPLVSTLELSGLEGVAEEDVRTGSHCDNLLQYIEAATSNTINSENDWKTEEKTFCTW